jgi:hypothetical protein
MKWLDDFKASLLTLGPVAAILVGGVNDGNTDGAYGSTFPTTSSYVPCLPGSGGDLKTDAEPPLLITIDTSQRQQTIHGFGASDAWSRCPGQRWFLRAAKARGLEQFSASKRLYQRTKLDY